MHIHSQAFAHANMTKIRLLALATIVLTGGILFGPNTFTQQAAAATGRKLLGPTDLTYVGAFRLPAEASNGSVFAYGGEAMAYRPDGDPNGPNDGTPGSLFIVGHPYQEEVAEVQIPALRDQRSVGIEGLRTASFLQGFTDITEGKAASLDQDNGYKLSGLGYLPAQTGQDGPKLYWTARPYYNVSFENHLSHGMSNPDFDNLQSAGLWRLGGSAQDVVSRASRTAGYLVPIPEAFADTYLDGRRIGSGLFTLQGIANTSVGPALFAFAPWKDDTTDGSPAAGASLGVKPLMYYPCLEGRPYAGCTGNLNPEHDADGWGGMAWIETETSETVVVVGRRAGGSFYGTQRPGDCEQYQGYHGDPYNPSFLFYDPNDFADVAAGKKDPTKLKPYAETDPSRYLVEECSWSLTGAGYDPSTKLLYVLQMSADDTQPLVYAFRVTGTGSSNGEPTPAKAETKALIAAGAGPGGGPQVRLFDSAGNWNGTSFFAFNQAFRGGIRIAAGDVDGDDKDEIIVGAGPGGGPHVRVFERDGTPKPIQFFAFLPSFRGGIDVAAGDVDGDGKDEIGVCQFSGGQAWVKVYKYNAARTVLGTWNAFGAPEIGCTITMGDVNGDGKAEVIVGAGAGGGPHVRVFNANGTPRTLQFFAFQASSRTGVDVDARDTNGNGRAEIAVSQLKNGQAWTKLYGTTSDRPVIAEFNAYGAPETGANVTLGNVAGNATLEILTAPNHNGGPQIRAFTRKGVPLGSPNFFAFANTFRGGATVAVVD